MSRATYRRFYRALVKATKGDLERLRTSLKAMYADLEQEEDLTEDEHEKLEKELRKLFQELKEMYGEW